MDKVLQCLAVAEEKNQEEENCHHPATDSSLPLKGLSHLAKHNGISERILLPKFITIMDGNHTSKKEPFLFTKV